VKQILLVSALLLAISLPLSAQTQKIGYVNSAKIFQELPEAKDAQRRIDAMQKSIQDSLELMQRQFQTKYEDYQKKESLMNEAAKRSAQEELVSMQRDFELYRQQKLGNDSELAKESERLLEPLKEKVLKAIERVARDEKYSFIFDRTDQVTVLLYGDSNHDLTYKVIDKLKRGK
jgi:outer membrane protein